MTFSIISKVLFLASFLSSITASPARDYTRYHNEARNSTGALNGTNDLQPLLSSAAEIYYPGSVGYINATTRWSADTKPGLDVIVKVATEEDVQATVSSFFFFSSSFIPTRISLIFRTSKISEAKISIIDSIFLTRSDMPTPALSHFSLSMAATVRLACSLP